MFREEYAPRSAVYEALPGFLLRLAGPGPDNPLASPLWLRLSSGAGSYDPERSTVHAAYDFGRSEAEAGLIASLGEDSEGWISVHHVRASADVSSPAGDGSVEVLGTGPAIGAAWRGTNGYYASGTFSLTFFNMDLSSDKRGLLKADAGGYAEAPTGDTCEDQEIDS